MGSGRSPSGRLSRAAEFERVYRHGRSQANRHLVLYAFPNESSEPPRIGLSVPRKVGNAVERNRVKRLLRAAFEEARGDVGEGYDVVVVARPAASELAQREGLAGMRDALAELLRRSGLILAGEEDVIEAGGVGS
jgi:ribonuclease P protein component